MCAMSPRLLRPRATGFNPKSISGLEAWYAADVASSITIGTGVQQWSDLSGKGRHLTQAVTNDQPLNTITTLNGKPVVTFDGTSDFMRTSAFSLSQPFQVFAAWRMNNPVSGQYFMDGRIGSGARNTEVLAFAGPVQLTLFSGALFSTSGATATAGISAFNVWDIEFNGASSRIRLRKTAVNQTGNAGTNPFLGLTLGANGAATAASFSNSDIAELLIYSRVLSESEADKVRKHLGTKWGLSYLS